MATTDENLQRPGTAKAWILVPIWDPKSPKNGPGVKNIRAQIDLPRIKHLLPAYDGDMFGTSGNYWQGQIEFWLLEYGRINIHRISPRIHG